MELGEEAFGVGHDGLRVLLLLLHVHVHVPHCYLVAEVRHPAVRVLPCHAMEAELLRLLWGSWRGRRRRCLPSLVVAGEKVAAAGDGGKTE